MRFQVPQFIETETKIIGPFTLKQFLWLAGGVVMMFLFNFLLPPKIFIAVAILIGAASITFAYLKIEGLPLATYLLRALSFSLSSKKYMFTKRDDIQTFSLNEKRSGDEYKF